VEKAMENAEQQARSQVDSILEMVAALRNAHNDEHREAAETAIQEDPLSIEVRGDWHAVGAESAKPSEFKIELCTGGPAVRIVGELNEYNEPECGFIQFQDWFTAWQLLPLNDAESEAVLEYCRQFYFAEP
jgi:hypothetical protein